MKTVLLLDRGEVSSKSRNIKSNTIFEIYRIIEDQNFYNFDYLFFYNSDNMKGTGLMHGSRPDLLLVTGKEIYQLVSELIYLLDDDDKFNEFYFESKIGRIFTENEFDFNLRLLDEFKHIAETISK